MFYNSLASSFFQAWAKYADLEFSHIRNGTADIEISFVIEDPRRPGTKMRSNGLATFYPRKFPRKIYINDNVDWVVDSEMEAFIGEKNKI